MKRLEEVLIVPGLARESTGGNREVVEKGDRNVHTGDRVVWREHRRYRAVYLVGVRWRNHTPEE